MTKKVNITRSEVQDFFKKSVFLKENMIVIKYFFHSNKELKNKAIRCVKMKNNTKKLEESVKSLISFIESNKLKNYAIEIEELYQMVKNSNKLEVLEKKIKKLLEGEKDLQTHTINLLKEYKNLKEKGKIAHKEREALYYIILKFVAKN